MATILIVDDTRESLALLTDVLRPLHRVRAVTSGHRALQLATSWPHPDLILLDVTLPEMSGYEVMRRLRDNRATEDIPVIFVSPRESDDDEAKGLALGAVDYINKPIKPAIVVARIATHLELKAARELLRDSSRRLSEELSRQAADQHRIRDLSLCALARLTEIRDPETGHHLRRTQGYVFELAEKLRAHPRFATFLTPAHIELLVKSAPLHDIGKVGIPDSILLKPGRLTPDEWRIMQSHSRLGYLAIEQAERDARRPIDFLGMAKEIALHHHEKWDGSGYPEGLAGEAIPISARLMALADVFDALIFQRVYKGALPLENALEIIRQGRGTHFDPDVVDVFFQCVDEFIAIAARHRETHAETVPGF